MRISKPDLDALVTAIMLADVYIQYVRERNRQLHDEADGTPSAWEAICKTDRVLKKLAYRNGRLVSE